MPNITDFMPHGHCYLWRTDILLMHVGGDIMIFISYMLIPIFIQKFIKGRSDIKSKWIFTLFQLFIIFCGFTHLLEIISVWVPLYFASGMLKVATGLISLITAIYMARVIKRLSAVKSFNTLVNEDEFHISTILNNLVEGYVIYNAKNETVFSYFKQPISYFENQIRELSFNEFLKKIFNKNLDELISDEIYEVDSGNGLEYIVLKKQKHLDNNILIFEVITELKKMEDEKRKQSELTSLVINNIPALISYISVDERYLLVNNEYNKYWGVDTNTILGKKVEEILPHDLYAFARPHIRKALNGEDVFYTAEYIENGERKTFDVAYLPYLLNGKVQGFVTTGIDTSENSRHEALLLNKNLELEKISKDLENLIYFVSHDLQAPLRHILSFSNMLVKDIDATDEQKQYVDIINSSCDRARGLIEGILNVANLREQPLIDCAIESIFYSFLNVARKENEDVVINYKIKSGLKIKCIPLYLSLAFENILNNAMRIFSESKTLQKELVISLVESSDDCVIYFEDNAGGIKKEHIEKIFNMFSSFTANKSSGLGLAIVAKICDLHHTSYGVYNNVNGGATFWISLKKA